MCKGSNAHTISIVDTDKENSKHAVLLIPLMCTCSFAYIDNCGDFFSHLAKLLLTGGVPVGEFLLDRNPARAQTIFVNAGT